MKFAVCIALFTLLACSALCQRDPPTIPQYCAWMIRTHRNLLQSQLNLTQASVSQDIPLFHKRLYDWITTEAFVPYCEKSTIAEMEVEVPKYQEAGIYTTECGMTYYTFVVRTAKLSKQQSKETWYSMSDDRYGMIRELLDVDVKCQGGAN